MAIDDNTLYGLTGAQVKELPGKIEAVKGKAKMLTTDDYDYPETNPTGVALWLLEPGLYILPTGVVGYTQIYFSAPQTALQGAWLVTRGTYGNNPVAGLYVFNGVDKPQYYTTKLSDGSRINEQTFFTTVVDNLTSISRVNALSANQGRILKDMIDAITGFSYEVVQTLPASGQSGKIYLVPIDESGGPADNVYEEYIWVNNAWEMIGTTEMDLTNYVQFSDLATVATSGSYADLSNKPTIPSVVQTTGTSTTDAMSQNAVTSMVYADPSTKYNVAIGNESGYTVGSLATAVGGGTRATAERSVALGSYARAQHPYSIALGAGAGTSAQGEMSIEIKNGVTNAGYNNTQYRLLTGLYDPQSAHDAATKGYVDTAISGISVPGTFTTNEWNALWA